MILGWSNGQGLKKLQREERQEAVATGTGSGLFDAAEADRVTVCDTGCGKDWGGLWFFSLFPVHDPRLASPFTEMETLLILRPSSWSQGGRVQRSAASEADRCAHSLAPGSQLCSSWRPLADLWKSCRPNHSQAGRVMTSAEDPGDSVNSWAEHPAFSSLFQGLARPSHRSDIPSARPSGLAGGVNTASRGSQSRSQHLPQDRHLQG